MTYLCCGCGAVARGCDCDFGCLTDLTSSCIPQRSALCHVFTMIVLHTVFASTCLHAGLPWLRVKQYDKGASHRPSTGVSPRWAGRPPFRVQESALYLAPCYSVRLSLLFPLRHDDAVLLHLRGINLV